VGGGYVWLTRRLDETVWKIDPLVGRLESIVHLAHQPIDVAFGEGAVWTANADATVSRVDPKTERVQTIALGRLPRLAFPVRIVAGEGVVWVTLQ
jgi:streptogramin lyase